MTEIIAAHLERVAQLERARELSRESRAVYQKAYTGDMKRSVMQRHQDGLEAQAELLAAALAACAREEREACKADIQDAIGNWGGPEREHYAQAMQRAMDAIEKRAQGLDLWGRALERAAGEKA